MTMNYYNLGNSGLRVSRLALGTMTFGTELGWGADKETARAMFDAYVEAGGNFFDTADLYTGGTAETWLGEFVAERSLRDKAVIATKFTMNTQPGNPNAGGNGRKNIMRAIDASLKRLGTDYIDLYLLHIWDRLTPAEEVLRTLDDLVRAGKVRHIGLSDVPAWYAGRAQAIAELRGYEPVSALQLEYSFAERAIEHEFVPFGTRHGAGIMVWSPLANGLLSGKYRPTQAGNAGRLDGFRNTTHPGFRKFSDRNWTIVAELEKVAAGLGHSMAQVALNWVATQPGIRLRHSRSDKACPVAGQSCGAGFFHSSGASATARFDQQRSGAVPAFLLRFRDPGQCDRRRRDRRQACRLCATGAHRR